MAGEIEIINKLVRKDQQPGGPVLPVVTAEQVEGLAAQGGSGGVSTLWSAGGDPYVSGQLVHNSIGQQFRCLLANASHSTEPTLPLSPSLGQYYAFIGWNEARIVSLEGAVTLSGMYVYNAGGALVYRGTDINAALAVLPAYGRMTFFSSITALSANRTILEGSTINFGQNALNLGGKSLILLGGVQILNLFWTVGDVRSGWTGNTPGSQYPPQLIGGMAYVDGQIVAPAGTFLSCSSTISNDRPGGSAAAWNSGSGTIYLAPGFQLLRNNERITDPATTLIRSAAASVVSTIPLQTSNYEKVVEIPLSGPATIQSVTLDQNAASVTFQLDTGTRGAVAHGASGRTVAQVQALIDATSAATFASGVSLFAYVAGTNPGAASRATLQVSAVTAIQAAPTRHITWPGAQVEGIIPLADAYFQQPFTGDPATGWQVQAIGKASYDATTHQAVYPDVPAENYLLRNISLMAGRRYCLLVTINNAPNGTAATGCLQTLNGPLRDNLFIGNGAGRWMVEFVAVGGGGELYFKGNDFRGAISELQIFQI